MTIPERPLPLGRATVGTLLTLAALLLAAPSAQAHSDWGRVPEDVSHRIVVGERGGKTFIVYKKGLSGDGKCHIETLEEKTGFPNLGWYLYGSSQQDIIVIPAPGGSATLCERTYYHPTKIKPNLLWGVRGNGGDDIIVLGVDVYDVRGGNGKDFIFSPASTVAEGNAHKDFIHGPMDLWNDKNAIYGGDGDDTVCLLPDSVTNPSHGILKGGKGYDTLHGSRVNQDGGFDAFKNYDSGCMWTLMFMAASLSD